MGILQWARMLLFAVLLSTGSAAALSPQSSGYHYSPLFEVNSFRLKPEGVKSINDAIATIGEGRFPCATIVGNSDVQEERLGTATFIRQHRAEIARDALIRGGVAPEHITMTPPNETMRATSIYYSSAFIEVGGCLVTRLEDAQSIER